MPISLSIRLGLGSNSAPSIIGPAQVGAVLSISPITLVGTEPLTYVVQWYRNGVPIIGATGATYTTLPSDAGYGITVSVTDPSGITTSSFNAIFIAADPAAAYTLENPLDEATSATTAELSVTTDAINGTIYAMHDTMGVFPDGPTIQANARYTKAVTSPGLQVITLVGLTPATSFDPVAFVLKVGSEYFGPVYGDGFQTSALTQVAPGFGSLGAMPAKTGDVRIGWNPPEYSGQSTFSVIFEMNRLKGAWGFGGGAGQTYDSCGYPTRPIIGNVESRVLNSPQQLAGLAPYSGSFRLYGRGSGTISDASAVPGAPLFGSQKVVNDNPADSTTNRAGIEVIGGVNYWYVDLNYDLATYYAKNLGIRIRDTDPLNVGDNIRDMALIHSSHITAFLAGKILAPDVADDLSRSSCIRWMQQLGANVTSGVYNITEAEAIKRYIPEDNFNYSKIQAARASYGVAYPVERICKVMNELGAIARARNEKPPAMWYNFDMAVPDWKVAELASYIFAHLDSDVGIYFEYGNEIWNGAKGFMCYRYAASAALATWGTQDRARWGGYKIKSIKAIVDPLNVNGHRVDYVGAGAAVATSFNIPFLAESESNGRCCTIHAVGGYFGLFGRDAADFAGTYINNFQDQARLYYKWWRWHDTPYVTCNLANLPSNGGTPTFIPDGRNVFCANPLAQFGVFTSLSDAISSFAMAIAHYEIVGNELRFDGEVIGTFETAPGGTVIDMLASGRMMPHRLTAAQPGWGGMFANSKSQRVTNHLATINSGVNGLGEPYSAYMKLAHYEGGISSDGTQGSSADSTLAFNYRLHYGDDADQVLPRVARDWLNWISGKVELLCWYKSAARFPYNTEVFGAKMLCSDVNVPSSQTKLDKRKKWDMVQSHRVIETAVVAPTVLTINDFSRDKVVFDTGAAKGNSTASVPLSGAATPGAVIEYRINRSSGTQLTSWATLATANSSGVWSGVAIAPRNSYWLKPMVRLAANQSVTATTTNMFGAGHVIALWGQSEWQRAILSAFTHVALPVAVTDDDALQITINQDNGTPEHVYITDAVVTGSARFDALGAMSNLFAAHRPGDKFHILWHALSGTSLKDLLDDTTPAVPGPGSGGRDWTLHDVAIKNAGLADGQRPGLQWMSWYSADAGTYGASMTDGWYGALLKKRKDGSTLAAGDSYGSYRYDHFLSDMYDPNIAPVVISGPHRFENSAYQSSLPAVRNSWITTFADPDFAAVAKRGMEIVTYLNTNNDTAHPSSSSVDGYERLLSYTALDMLQQMGFGTWPTPEFDNAYLDPARAYVEVWSSAGAITTTRIAESRGGTPPGGTVWGFKVNGVATTATSIVSGRVRITRTWADGDVLTFAGDNVGDNGNPTGSWADYPIVNLGQPLMPGIAIRPNTPQSVLGVIPASSIPADTNTNSNLADTDFTNFVNVASGSPQVAGWPTLITGVTLPGDGTAVFATSSTNTSFTGHACDNATGGIAGLTGKMLELAFVLTTPDAGSGKLLVTVTAIGGGSTQLLATGDITPTVGARNKFTCTAAVPSGRTGITVAIRRRPTSVGTFVFSNITLKEV